MDRAGIRILSPTAILGYGFPEASFAAGMDRRPDAVAVDAGSTDPGPYYLGTGTSFTNRTAVKRDLRIMLCAAVPRRIPVIIGSAGGSGAATHVQWCREIITEIAAEQHLSFRMGVLHADISTQAVLDAIAGGRVVPLEGLAALGAGDVESSAAIVAQMGMEPVIGALEQGCDVVLAGRAYDPSVFAALPVMRGLDRGLAVHCGKILECAAIAADPGSGADCVLGTIAGDSFVLEPLSDARRFTRYSTAAHSLYEKSDPVLLHGPGGRLDLTDVTFTELDGGRVEVKGSRFEPTEKYWIKLEGVRSRGFRTVSVAGVRDPVMISGIDGILDAVQAQVRSLCGREGVEGQCHIHVYGRDGVMGPLEPVRGDTAHELGLVIETVARSQQQADTLCSMTRSTLLHYGYPGRISTAGNLAFPFSPSDIPAGEVFEFSIYHLMQVDDPCGCFPLSVVQVGG